MDVRNKGQIGGIGGGLAGGLGGPQNPNGIAGAMPGRNMMQQSYYNPAPAEYMGGQMLGGQLGYGGALNRAFSGLGDIFAGNRSATQATQQRNYGWAQQMGMLPFDVASNSTHSGLGDFQQWLKMNQHLANTQDARAQRQWEQQMNNRRMEEAYAQPERERNRQLLLTMIQDGSLSKLLYGGMQPFAGGLGGFTTNFGASGGVA